MKAIRDGNHILVYDAYLIRNSIKDINGWFYDPTNKVWGVPYSKENVALLVLLGVEPDESLSIEIKQEDAGDEVPIFSMPIKAKPYQHQVRAFNFALRTFGIGGIA